MTRLVSGLRRRSVALVPALAAVLALGAALPASAVDGGGPDGSARAQNYWGAIAISIDGAYGTSWDYPRKAGALKRAKAECKVHSEYPGKCENVVYTVNGCAAVSVKFNSNGFARKYAYAFGTERRSVVRVAQRRCVRAYGKKCQRLTSVCTSRP